MKRTVNIFGSVAIGLVLGLMNALPVKAYEESFAIDPDTGDYRIRYQGTYDGELVEAIFAPATRITEATSSIGTD